MTAIKTIFFIIVIQLIGTNLVARELNNFHITVLDTVPRPGDGPDKHDPKTKDGESLKGYFYRLYGEKVLAKDVKFKGPFKKLKKLKSFLKKCQENYPGSYIVNRYSNPTYTEKIWLSDPQDAIAHPYKEIKKSDIYGIILHSTLQTRLDCTLYGDIKDSQKWVAVYLDSDSRRFIGNIYINYENCDSDYRKYLEDGEYSVLYDENPNCHADLLGSYYFPKDEQ